MRPTVGCSAILLAACCGCCCGRIPTFGFGPEPDLAALEAALKEEPFLLDGLCRTEATCAVVEDATLVAHPVGYNPLTGTWVALVEVEASCVSSTDPVERAAPFLCAGVLAAVATGGAASLTDDTVWALPTAGVPSGGGGDWDWD